MSISAKKPSPPAAVWPESKTSARCYSAGSCSLLGNRCNISLKPVIDLPAGHTPVDSYELPARLREQLQLRYPADVFLTPPG